MKNCYKKIFFLIFIAFFVNNSAALLVKKSCPLHCYETKDTTSSQNLCVAVIGAGYVGLVTAACLAEFGNQVICADIDADKIAMLTQGIVPIYEKGLEALMQRHTINNSLLFTTHIGEAIQAADCIFIAVDTPMNDEGAADLTSVHAVLKTIAQYLNGYKVIVTKSTVPIGTGDYMHTFMVQQGYCEGKHFDIVANPEFLREGSAVYDFLNPDRIVFGASSENARDILYKIYRPLLESTPCVWTTVVSAETIKYASNAFLAVKLSFINEIANLCDKTGANIDIISQAMGMDHRIGSQFLSPGPGFGGSCFPKDTQALLYMSKQYDTKLHVVQSALIANALQQKIPLQKIVNLMQRRGENLQNKTVAILGLAFKANTDDVRYSPTITTIKKLLQHGTRIQAYDPAAKNTMQKIFPHIVYCDSLYDAVNNVDAIIVMTEWDEFKYMDVARIASLVKTKCIIDMRNIINIEEFKNHGFVCDIIGKSCFCTQ